MSENKNAFESECIKFAKNILKYDGFRKLNEKEQQLIGEVIALTIESQMLFVLRAALIAFGEEMERYGVKERAAKEIKSKITSNRITSLYK